MVTEFDRRAQTIVEKLIDLPEAGRLTTAERMCGGDARLLKRVTSLLSRMPMLDGFMSDATVDVTAAAAVPVTEKAGSMIGRYKLIEQIGEGGFGVVFKAEQERPVRRLVALKIIKLGMDTREVVARFEAERQALAMMDHPNIARVLDAGSTEAGRPYFVMELVRGSPITEYCDKRQLGLTDRVSLMAQVCRAVQHAHGKGVIHRDLKPSNVLVTVADDRPIPKVIDFGIAKATQSKLTEHTLHTGFRQLIGTPQYMSPEQADSDGVDVDTRTDVYSLGVLAYELLVGTTPFDARELRSAAYEAMRKMIRENDVPRPATRLSTMAADSKRAVAASRSTDVKKLSDSVKGELDWIVMKALEKDRTRRYETAAALADDLNRYLAGEAVLAGPVSGWYRIKKSLRRYKATVAVGLAIAACLILGVIGTSWGLVQARWQRSKAETNAVHATEAEHRATDQARAAESARAQADGARGDAESQAVVARRAAARSDARYLLGERSLQDAYTRAIDAWNAGGLWEDGYTLDQLRAASRSDWRLLAVMPADGAAVGCFCSTGADDLLVLADQSGVTAHSIRTGKQAGHVLSASPVPKLVADPSGNAVTVFRVDGIDRLSLPDLRPLASRQLETAWASADANAAGVMVLDHDGNCRVFSPADLSDVARLDWSRQPSVAGGARPTMAALSPSGRRVLLRSDWWSPVQLWDLNGTDKQALVDTGLNQVDQFQFVTNDAVLTWEQLDATGSGGGFVRVTPLNPAPGRSPDAGQKLKQSGQSIDNGTIKKSVGVEAWVGSAGDDVHYALVGSVGYLAGSTDDRARPSENGSSDAMNAVRYNNLVPTNNVPPTYLCGSFQRGLLAIRDHDRIRVFRPATERPLESIRDFSVTACRDGMMYLGGGHSGGEALVVTPFDRARPVVQFPLQWAKSSGSTPNLMPWGLGTTADGSTIVVIAQESSGGNTTKDVFGTSHAMVYRAVTGQAAGAMTLSLARTFDLESAPVGNWDPRSVAVDPDGRVMLWLSVSNGARRYSLTDGKPLASLPLSGIARPSADGRLVAGLDRGDGSLAVFDIATGNRLMSVPGHTGAAGVCLSADNHRLFVGDGAVLQTYSVPAGQLLASVATPLIPLAAPAENVPQGRLLAFKPDGAGDASGDLVMITNDAQVCTVLARAGTSGYPAFLSPDGRSAALLLSRWRAGMFRSITPEQLNAAMDTIPVEPASDPDGPPLETVKVEPRTSSVVDTVDPADTAALEAHLGKAVHMKGSVKAVTWGVGKNVAYINPAGVDEHVFVFFLPPKSVRKFRDTGGDDFLTGLSGKEFEVEGKVTRYLNQKTGQSILELAINDPSQLKVISDDQHPPTIQR